MQYFNQIEPAVGVFWLVAGWRIRRRVGWQANRLAGGLAGWTAGGLGGWLAGKLQNAYRWRILAFFNQKYAFYAGFKHILSSLRPATPSRAEKHAKKCER